MSSDELGRWGEKRFASLCTDARLVPQKPEYDLNGWDYLVEFPQAAIEASTDLVARQQPLQCFVQVKTVWEGRPEVKLSLSAAARLGKSPLPSFLCILEASDEMEVRRIHVIHMAGPILEQVLRKMRELQAAHQSVLINKVDFRVPLPSASEGFQPTGDELVRAIEDAVGPDYAVYRQRKATFLDSAGFPTLRLSGSMTLKTESPTDCSDFVLGLKPLPIADMTTVETRWGISVPFNFESKPVTIQVTPHAMDVEIVWRRVGVSKSVRLKMKAILAADPLGDTQHDQWLLTHPNLEVRISGSSYHMKMKGTDMVRTSYRTLVQLHALEELVASEGQIEMQFLWRGKFMMGWHPEGTLQLRPSEQTAALGKILHELSVVLSSAGLQDIDLPAASWGEWETSLHRLHAMLATPEFVSFSVAVKVPENKIVEPGERETLYVSALEFNGSALAYYATCRGRLEVDTLPQRGTFHASDFVVRDLRILENSEESMRAFAKEAEAITGLTATILIWGVPFGQKQAEPS